MRLAAIGDVHGCAEEFEILLKELQKENLDYIVQVGDLIHKGPYSSEAVRLSQEYVDIQIAGNHEHKHLRWIKHQIEGTQHMMRNVENYEDVNLTDSQVEYLYSAVCASTIKNISFVHGGLQSNITQETFNKIRAQNLKTINKKHDISFLFRRFEDENCNAVHLDHQSESDVYWANKYQGQVGYVFFGHQVFPQPTLFPHAMGIDTGCVYGQQLTAVIFDSQNGSFRPIQVNAKQTYYKGIQ